MNEWFASKRLLVWLLAVVGTAAWGIEGKDWWQPVFDPVAVTWLSVAYIAGQSLVDYAKARGGAR